MKRTSAEDPATERRYLNRAIKCLNALLSNKEVHAIDFVEDFRVAWSELAEDEELLLGSFSDEFNSHLNRESEDSNECVYVNVCCPKCRECQVDCGPVDHVSDGTEWSCEGCGAEGAYGEFLFPDGQTEFHPCCSCDDEEPIIQIAPLAAQAQRKTREEKAAIRRQVIENIVRGMEDHQIDSMDVRDLWGWLAAQESGDYEERQP